MSRRFALALAAVIATALAVDLSAFLLGWRPAGSEPERFFRPDPLLGHAHQPNVAGEWYLADSTSWVETNGFGMADSDRDLAKVRPRIALLGDSTIQFWEAPLELRPQTLLAKRLGGEFEVLNFGVRGYGTDQSLLLLQELVVHFAPDVIVYTLCINDLYDNTRVSNLQHTLGKPRFLLSPDAPNGLELTNYPAKAQVRTTSVVDLLEEYSFLYRALRNSLGRPSPWREVLEEEARRLNGAPVRHPEIRPYLEDYAAVDRERLELAFRLIEAMARVSKEIGAKFLLVEGLHLYPLDDGLRRDLVAQYGSVFDFERLTFDLQSFAARESIEVLSLPDVARARRVNVHAIMHDDVHLNGRGARFFARAVARKLRHLDWAASQGGAELQDRAKLERWLSSAFHDSSMRREQ
jgi:lysophospholipase L1-like esterase